jgi:hypothetical protein
LLTLLVTCHLPNTAMRDKQGLSERSTRFGSLGRIV